MPRKGQVARRDAVPDPKFESVLVTRFVCAIMKRGKRSLAERAFYGAMSLVEQKTGQDAMTILKQAMTNVKPALEVKSRRVGGANYQVPVEVRPVRRMALAMRWLREAAKKRSEKSMPLRLAGELMEAAEGRGGAMKKKEEVHRMAEANKAFAHFRF